MVVNMTPEKIHHGIEKMIASGVSYIDAIVEYARINNLEIETVAEVIKKSPTIKEKIRSEAIALKLVKKDESDETDITSVCE